MRRSLIIALAVVLLFTFTACAQSAQPTPTPAPPQEGSPAPSTPGEETPAPGPDGNGLSYVMENDGVYRKLYSGEMTTLNYLYTGTTNEFSVLANLIDTLVEYDKYGVVKPSLAESWEVNDTDADPAMAGRVWTFHLRPGVKWVDYQGNEVAEVKAQDFVDAAQWVLTAANDSQTSANLVSVLEGAEAYFNGETSDFSTVGVKAVDDTTLQYTLVAPTPYFLSMLTYVCFMPVNGDFLREQGENFGTYNNTILYNGAYILSDFQPQASRTLTRNESYWDKDNVFIAAIEETYNKEASTIAPEMFKRGEVDYATISSDILDDWMNGEDTRDMVKPGRNGYYTYFYAFNFDPKFDAQYEPDNWKIAVNNANFRKSIFYGLDRLKAKTVSEPNNPQKLIINTITPPDFVDLAGKDYVEIGDLAALTARDSFNSEEALKYKAAAVEELTAAGATFPIKMLMPYNPSVANWDKENQVIEQQLEGLLGSDYIDIIIEAGPQTGFLAEVRRSGKYAFMQCNWGPDYADPETYTDPFVSGSSYNFPEFCVGYEEADGTKTYDKLVSDAKAIRTDVGARYEAFAKAEAFFINEAFVIPYCMDDDGYSASRLNPFDSQYSPFGVSTYRYKGQRLLQEPMNTEQYYAAFDQWTKERASALAAAK